MNGARYLALFAFAADGEQVRVDCARADIPEGRWRDLWSGDVYTSENGFLTWNAAGCDALLLVNESTRRSHGLNGGHPCADSF